VTDLAALVALLAATGGAAEATAGTASRGGRALAGKVTGLAALVAGLLLGGLSALAGKVTLVAAVVAGGGTLGGALAGLVRRVAACKCTCQ
jgi:hypothetical protein